MEMHAFYKIVFFVFCGVVAVNGRCSTHVDPCLDTVYHVLDDPTRSTTHTFGWPVKNDFFLSENWYRSISKAGGDMSMVAPAILNCNAYAPIWLNGNIPSTAEGIQSAQACAVFIGGDCVRTYSIMVKNCGAYRVYCLPPTNAYDRYCFGAESPCSPGSSSLTGFTPNCLTDDGTLTLVSEPTINFAVNYETRELPDLDEPPNLPELPNLPEVPNKFCQPYYEFLCNIIHDNPSAYMDVRWYADVSADGAQRELVAEFIGTNAIAYADLPSMITSDMLVEMGYLLGTHITCRINARAAQSNTALIGPPKEVAFFAGVIVDDSSQFIELAEGGNPGTYSGNYTIPYRCEFSLTSDEQCRDELHRCDLKIDVGVANIDSVNGGCPATGQDVTLKVPREQSCIVESGEYGFSIEVNANPDHVYKPRRELVLQLQVLNTHNTFWSFAFLPRAVVVINDTDDMLGGSSCIISDDPHILSFDTPTWSEIHLEGAFLMYRHRTLPISVEVYFKRSTSGHFTRNCGGAVRSGGQVFVYDNCRDNEAKRITLYECDEGLQQMVVNQITSKRYQIILPTGTKVILGTQVQYVNPSIFDWGQTEGICGNFNGIDTPEDDKVIRYTNTVDYGTPHSIWTNRLEHNNFSNSYRIQENETLYFGYVRDTLDYDDLYFCQCSNDTNNPGAGCSVSPNVDCLAGESPYASGFSHRCTLNRKKRQAINPDTVEPVPNKLFDYDPDFVAGVNNVVEDEVEEWSEERATNHCTVLYTINTNTHGYGYTLEELEFHQELAVNRCIENFPFNGIPFSTSVTEEWSEEGATDHCSQVLNNNTNVHTCERVPHISLENTLDNCVADILMTGSTELDQLHVNVFLEQCKEEVERYNFTPNDTTILAISPEDVQNITQNLCPEECSGNGDCINGLCQCFPGFSGISCDIDLLTPPVLFELSNNGVCDLNMRPCRQVVLAGDPFLKDSVVCKVQYVNVDGVPYSPDNIASAEYMHSQKVICSLFGLGLPPAPPYFVALSVSNDGLIFSGVKIMSVVYSP